MRPTNLIRLGIVSALVLGASGCETAPRAALPAALPNRIQSEYQAGGASGPIVVDGDLAYVGRGAMVAVADLAAPGGPAWIGQSAALAGAVTRLAFWEGHLYGLVGEDGQDEDFVVLSLAEPAGPKKVGGRALGGASADLAVGEGRAWLSVLDSGDRGQFGAVIVGLDLGDGGRPVEWASLSVPRLAVSGEGGDPPGRPAVQALGPWLLLGQDGPEETWLEAQVRSLRVHAGRQPTWHWNLSGQGQTILAMASDGPARRVYAIVGGYYGNRLLVADLLPDGRLERRASVILSESATVDCPGHLTPHGTWLLYATGCPDGRSAIFDLRDLDEPVEVLVPGERMPVVSFASSGNRLVAGGPAGDLMALDPSWLPDIRVIGQARGMPAPAPVTSPPDPELNRPIADEPDPEPWPMADLDRGRHVAMLPYAAQGALARRGGSRRPAPFSETRTLGHRFGTLAVEGDGRRLWAADGNAVVGLDLATEQLDEVARSAELPDSIRHLAVDGDLLLATGTDQRLHVLSRSAAGDPVLLGSLALPDVAEGLVAKGGVAYVATSLAGVLTVDLSRPAWPRIVHQLPTLAPSMRLEALDGGLLWLGQGFSGLGTRQAAVVSLADPARPAWGPDLPGSFQDHAHYAACGDDLFAFGNGNGFVAGRMDADLRVTELPDWTMELWNLSPNFGNVFLQDMACSNRRLAVFGEYYLGQVETDAAGYPSSAGEWKTSRFPWPRAMIVIGDEALLPYYDSATGLTPPGAGVMAVDLSTLGADQEQPPSHRVHGAMDDGPYAMARVGQVLFLGSVQWTGRAMQTSWLAVDMSVSGRPLRLGHVEDLAGAVAVLPEGEDQALAVMAAPGDLPKTVVRRLDMADPLKPTALDEVVLPDLRPFAAARGGNRLVVTLGSGPSPRPPQTGRFEAIDVTPGQPLRGLGTLPVQAETLGGSVFVEGDRAYVSGPAGARSTWVVDLAAAPRLTGQLPFVASSFARSGDHVFGLTAGGLATLDLAEDPAMSRVLGTAAGPGTGGPLQIAPLPDGRHIVHVSQLRQGLTSALRVLDVDGDGRPYWEEEYHGMGWVQLGSVDEATLDLVDGWLAYLTGPDSRPGNIGLRLLRVAP